MIPSFEANISASILIKNILFYARYFILFTWCQMIIRTPKISKMAAIVNIPQELKLKETEDVGLTWKKFKQSWHIYETATGNNEKPDNIRVATFLHVAGTDAIEKYNAFSWDEEGDQNRISKVIEKFDKDCQSTTNILIERKKFFKLKQKKGETCEQFVSNLRILCSTCEFETPEEHLRDQFVLNIFNTRAQERLLEIAQNDSKSLTFDPD